MPNARRALIAGVALALLAACHKSQPEQQQNADMNLLALDNSTAAGPTDIEALPPDESTATPSNQLVSGDDSPDVNDTTAKNSD